MKKKLLVLTILVATVGSVLSFPQLRSIASSAIARVQAPTSGQCTLYKLDPLTCKFGFFAGDYGGMIQDHMVKNRQGDIDFGHYKEGFFTVGIEGGTKGTILDLGHADTLKAKYGYAETVGGGQGFASIRFKENQLVILKDYEKQSTQVLQESNSLLNNKLSNENDHAPVQLGHLYLVRLVTDEAELFVKFIVVSHRPNESVTLRWSIIPRD